MATWNNLQTIYEKNKIFFNYSLIGVVGVSLDFIVFYLLTARFGVYYQYANAISVSLGITNNFILNAWFNFRLTDKIVNRFVKFYAIGLLGLAISAGLLYLFIDWFGLVPLIAKVITIGIVVVIQFTLNKKISFKNLDQVKP